MVVSNNKGWLTDYAILKKKIVKKTEEIIMKKALCRAEKKIVLMLGLTNC